MYNENSTNTFKNNTKNFNMNIQEKLKINQIKINDLNDIFDKSKLFETPDIIIDSYKKENLKYTDIVKIQDKFYMVFIEDSIHLKTNYFNGKPEAYDGVFYYYDEVKMQHKYSYMKLYDKFLKYQMKYSNKDITDVFSCSNTYPYKITKLEQLIQDELINIIETYNYTHIHIQ